jgi:hypothetical protein
MKSVTPLEQVKDLIAILDPYAELWQEWINTDACFLSDEEIKIIQNFLLFSSHYPSVIELNISLATAKEKLKRIKRRLKWNYPLYQKWVTERMLLNSGILNYHSKEDYLLNSPIEFIPMSATLRKRLNVFSVSTLNELLSNYTENDLRKIRLFGEKTITEFKHLLIEYNCSHLLRKTNNQGV